MYEKLPKSEIKSTIKIPYIYIIVVQISISDLFNRLYLPKKRKMVSRYT